MTNFTDNQVFTRFVHPKSFVPAATQAPITAYSEHSVV